MRNFQQKFDYIVCVDSDGCAMDTMNIKHQRYFGPLAAKFFAIEDSKSFLTLWDNINLHSKTRGINRFKGLVLSLEMSNYKDDFSALKNWVDNSDELSNVSLEKCIASQNDEKSVAILQKAYDWSIAVNQGIKELAGEDKPFANVYQMLSIISQFANVAVVSAANKSAILDEWERHKLMDFVDVPFGQEDGSKAACIKKLIQQGYAPNNILMVGDTPGDMNSAIETAVHFHPILSGDEENSWVKVTLESLGKLIQNKFDENYQNNLFDELTRHLN